MAHKAPSWPASVSVFFGLLDLGWSESILS
ncbi:BnaC02g12090D [Brassica napus]|uniref:BnaC02g12090D protein n=1 Tax=Brassica napus TaxID=3708 RepID=A0A078HYI3_BRANA|nr:BnaC02g12090D [Brassica napus]